MEAEESTGETLVWRRFMDLISDLSYRADSRRLGDDRLHEYFGEFRHYVAEKYAYNVENHFLSGTQPVDVSIRCASGHHQYISHANLDICLVAIVYVRRDAAGFEETRNVTRKASFEAPLVDSVLRV
jgi:hypothetical protein